MPDQLLPVWIVGPCGLLMWNQDESS